MVRKKAECTGCGACANICPKQAIAMEYDRDGFLMPFTDKESCIDCGQCEVVCPVSHTQAYNANKSIPRAYACWLKDGSKRANSTSGGAFTALAEYVLRQSGVIVGCVMGADLSAYHTLAFSSDTINSMHGSKYIQSETRKTYRLIKEHLKRDKVVLFTGCPCQIAGLYSYLQNESFDKLFTTDLVCHGVASNKFFVKYIVGKEAKYNSVVSSIRFRSKKRGWNKFTIKLTFNNGREIYIPSEKDAFMRCYYQRAIYRESCYRCSYAKMPRIGDFTIGDYLGLPKSVVKKAAFKKGISLITLNNERAERVFEKINNSLEYFERPISETTETNYNLVRPSVQHPKRNEILASDTSVEETARRYCRHTWKNKIASLVGPSAIYIIRKVLGRT